MAVVVAPRVPRACVRRLPHSRKATAPISNKTRRIAGPAATTALTALLAPMDNAHVPAERPCAKESASICKATRRTAGCALRTAAGSSAMWAAAAQPVHRRPAPVAQGKSVSIPLRAQIIAANVATRAGLDRPAPAEAAHALEAQPPATACAAQQAPPVTAPNASLSRLAEEATPTAALATATTPALAA